MKLNRVELSPVIECKEVLMLEIVILQAIR